MANGLYSFIPASKLHDVLETLHLYTGLQVSLIESDGTVLCTFGEKPAYCELLHTHLFPPQHCARHHADAGIKAQTLGEAYIFTCGAELNHIAFPFLKSGDLLGSVLVGPFLMDAPETTFVETLSEKRPLTSTLTLALYEALHALPVLSPSHTRHLKKLLDHLFLPLLPAEQFLLLQTQKNAYHQARVNETIQVYKSEGYAANGQVYFDKQALLLEAVKKRDLSGASTALERLVAHVYYTEGKHADTVRFYMQTLLPSLASAAVETGASPDLILTLQKQFFRRLQEEERTDMLSFHLREALESILNEILSASSVGNVHINAALHHMAKYYYTPLTLESVANAIGLSPNYFSALFRKTVGASFREELCKIRVEESKRLLLSTDYSLSDIAVAMGFNDQSYYCKVFKKITGVTPGKYRSK